MNNFLKIQKHLFHVLSNLPQATNYCTPAAFSCYSNISTQDFGCRKSCTGLYADVQHTKDAGLMNNQQVLRIEKDYHRYKRDFARNIIFDGARRIKGELKFSYEHYLNILFRKECSLPPATNGQDRLCHGNL